MLSLETNKAIKQALLLIEEESRSYGVEFTNSNAAKSYCKMKLAGQEREQFLVIFLTTKYALIDSEIMFSGTIDSAAIYPREVAKAALLKNAAAVIIAHNHPSGNATPSHADHEITKRLVSALNLLDINTLDHLIISDKDTYSFAESGLLGA